MLMHHRLGESPGRSQNEPTTVITRRTLLIFSSALMSNATAHCTLQACRMVQVAMTYLAEILSKSAAPGRTSTPKHFWSWCFLHCFDFDFSTTGCKHYESIRYPRYTEDGTRNTHLSFFSLSPDSWILRRTSSSADRHSSI